MVIAVDFDGTIVEDKYPLIGRERPFATEILRKFMEQRHHLVLWTMRNGEELEEALDWCRRRGVEFYAVNSTASEMVGEEMNPHLSKKLHADVFIDDRNIGGIPSWTEIYDIVTKGKTYEQVIRRKVRHEMEAQVQDMVLPYPKWMFWKKKKK